MLEAWIRGYPQVPKRLVYRRVFAAKMPAECQALQADEFSAHPQGAVKGTSC
jgi:hypothetical protein